MESKIHRILEAAIQAPSGDNCQPWKLVLSDQKVYLYNLPERDTSLYNHAQRASFVAHGALLENLSLAAAAEGLKATMTLFPSQNDVNMIASVGLAKDTVVSDPLVDAIYERCTNRCQFNTSELTTEEYTALSSCIKDLPDKKIILSESPEEKHRLANFASENDWLVFKNHLLHRFLFQQLRWDKQDVIKGRDGLDIMTLGLNQIDRLGFKFLKYWPAVNFLNFFGLAKVIKHKAFLSCRSAAALGAVIIRGSRPTDYIEGGRAMQRVWLQATALGLQFQPYAGIAFLMQHVREGSVKGMTPKSIAKLRSMNKEMQQRYLLNDECVLTFFRIGRSSKAPCISLRKQLDEVVTEVIK